MKKTWLYRKNGTNYLKSNGGDGKSIPTNHELNNFEEDPDVKYVDIILASYGNLLISRNPG